MKVDVLNKQVDMKHTCCAVEAVLVGVLMLPDMLNTDRRCARFSAASLRLILICVCRGRPF